MQRFSTLLTTTLMALAVAMPAMADEPVYFDITTTIVDVDPCTGTQHDNDVTFSVQQMDNQQTLVRIADATFTTETGYEGNGVVINVFTPNQRIEVFHHIVRNDDTGAAYIIHADPEWGPWWWCIAGGAN